MCGHVYESSDAKHAGEPEAALLVARTLPTGPSTASSEPPSPREIDPGVRGNVTCGREGVCCEMADCECPGWPYRVPLVCCVAFCRSKWVVRRSSCAGRSLRKRDAICAARAHHKQRCHRLARIRIGYRRGDLPLVCRVPLSTT